MVEKTYFGVLSLILFQDVIEVYPLTSIGQVQAISEDSDLSNVLVFCTMQTEHKYAAMHLFQSEKLPVSCHHCMIVQTLLTTLGENPWLLWGDLELIRHFIKRTRFTLTIQAVITT